jgi:uroporphyrinogen decarboxylase
MNSRERVCAALNHQQPDRPPVDLSGHRSSGISAIAYIKLRAYLGLPAKPPRIYDLLQQLAIVDDDVLDLFGVDTIELGRGFALDNEHWTDWVLPDGSPCLVPAWSVPERDEAQSRWVLRSDSGRILAQMPDGVLYFEQCYWPWLDGRPQGAPVGDTYGESMWTAVAAPPGPLADSWEKLATGAKALRRSTDKAIIGLFGGNLLELGQFMFRNDNFFLLLAGEPEQAKAFLAEAVEGYLIKLEHYLGAVGPYIDVILFGDDLGMQNGPQISPRMYRQIFKPFHQRMWARAKELAPVKVMLHCCGGVRELLPDLIDAGLDAINPVQTNCRGMDPEGLKADFGKDLTFWGGGCDTASILPRGTPNEVREHVRERLGIFAPGGGFVFQQVHNILADVPPENIVAMVEAVREF